MSIRFTKMHGLGNDFMVLDARRQKIHVTDTLIKCWSDRHTGIGFDQLLILESSDTLGIDFRYRIFNADATEVEHCGNGARCVALFAHRHSHSTQQEFRCSTMKGELTLSVLDNNRVSVAMGIPSFEPAAIPLLGCERADSYHLTLEAAERHDSHDVIEIGALSIGNPHAIMWVESAERAPVELVGPRVEGHHRFPARVNVGFAEIVSRGQLNLRVYERGVGETQACGTGACAAAVYGIQTGKLDSPVTVTLPGGKLEIEWRGEDQQVIMTGPASFVYDAELSDNGPECD